MDPTTRLADHVSDVIQHMSQLSAARDTAVNVSRSVVRASANTIRALHRGEDASDLLAEARSAMNQMVEAAEPFPSVYWAGYVQDAMKEFAEAAITTAILSEQSIPTVDQLAVEDTAWLNGLAEAGSELRRDTLDALRSDEIEQAEYLLATMDAIYSVLVTVDFPDVITGGLRRTTDQFRGVLERTRGDVTMSVRQARLELALRENEKRQF